jgi:hypothetical protein
MLSKNESTTYRNSIKTKKILKLTLITLLKRTANQI